jgi:hypothetical protein
VRMGVLNVCVYEFVQGLCEYTAVFLSFILKEIFCSKQFCL